MSKLTYKEFKALQKELCYIYENIFKIVNNQSYFSLLVEEKKYSELYNTAKAFTTNNIFLKFIVKKRLETIDYWNEHITETFRVSVQYSYLHKMQK